MTFRSNGYLGTPPDNPVTHKYILQDDKAYQIHDTLVHKFSVSDVEDPELYAAEPIYNWQQTEQGKWVMQHAIEPPVWKKHIDYMSYGYQYAIVAKLKGPDYTFFTLKWGQIV
jgi:hypothetical protein